MSDLNEQLAALKAAAEAATPGPWDAKRETDDECRHAGYSIQSATKAISDDGTAPSDADAQFIAAANPAAILALIAEVEAARRAPDAAPAPVSHSDERPVAAIKTWRERVPADFDEDDERDARNAEIADLRAALAAAPAAAPIVQPVGDEQIDTSTAANAGGLPVYLAKFPEGDSYAVVAKEQFEMASRMGYDVSTSTQQTRDAKAGGMSADDREARELARADQSPVRVTNAELAAFHRFCECAEDFESGGHDVPKAMMSQLVRIGLLRPAGPGRHQTTKFGDWMRDCDDRTAAADADGQSEEIDYGETVLRVQEALGITRTGWVSPDVVLLRIEQLKAAPEKVRQSWDLTCSEQALEIEHLKEQMAGRAPATSADAQPTPASSTADAKDASTWRGILEAMMREFPRNMGSARNGNAPGHCHDKPGIWDRDNGALAGTECAWCKVWNEARAAIATSAGEVNGGSHA